MVPFLSLIIIVLVVCIYIIYSKMFSIEKQMREIRDDLANINAKLVRLCSKNTRRNNNTE